MGGCEADYYDSDGGLESVVWWMLVQYVVSLLGRSCFSGSAGQLFADDEPLLASCRVCSAINQSQQIQLSVTCGIPSCQPVPVDPGASHHQCSQVSASHLQCGSAVSLLLAASQSATLCPSCRQVLVDSVVSHQQCSQQSANHRVCSCRSPCIQLLVICSVPNCQPVTCSVFQLADSVRLPVSQLQFVPTVNQSQWIQLSVTCSLLQRLAVYHFQSLSARQYSQLSASQCSGVPLPVCQVFLVCSDRRILNFSILSCQPVGCGCQLSPNLGGPSCQPFSVDSVVSHQRCSQLSASHLQCLSAVGLRSAASQSAAVCPSCRPVSVNSVASHQQCSQLSASPHG